MSCAGLKWLTSCWTCRLTGADRFWAQMRDSKSHMSLAADAKNGVKAALPARRQICSSFRAAWCRDGSAAMSSW